MLPCLFYIQFLVLNKKRVNLRSVSDIIDPERSLLVAEVILERGNKHMVKRNSDNGGPRIIGLPSR